MDALAAFKSSPLFRELDRRALRGLAETAEWRELHGGEFLYRAGDAGDAMYLVVNGRLRAQRPDAAGAPELLGEIGLGQTIGEIALVAGEPRSADALAVRDSRLLRISKANFDRLTRRHPDAMLRVMRVVVERLRSSGTSQPRDAIVSTRTIAVLPAHEGVDAAGFARELTRQLADAGSVLRLDHQRVDDALGESAAEIPFEHARNHRVVEWLNRIEDGYRHVVYEATARPHVWTRRCLRQADRILVVVDGASEPMDSPNLEWLRGVDLKAPIEVALLHDNPAEPGSPLAWRAACGAGMHHHVPSDLAPAAMARLGRLVTGRALCLVLGGGGARGFAHVGLLRALEEKGVPVDAIGGTSMGALVGALAAVGMDSDSVLRTLRETFLEEKYLNDYTVPRLGLIAGDKFRGRLDKLFGERRIEDLPVPFYCESANLSRGVSMLHDHGLVADWVGTSMAVPGFTPPNVYDGDLLVDGGALRSMPFEPMQALGRGPVVVSDVSHETDLHVEGVGADRPQSLARIKDASRRFNIFQLLFHTAGLAGEHERRDVARRADLVLHMPVSGVGMFDWGQIDEIVYRGYCHADEVLDAWLAGHEDDINLEAAS